MSARHNSGQEPLPLPLLDDDCEVKFRQSFGRRMTENEKKFMGLAAAVVDRRRDRNERFQAALMDHARVNCGISRNLVRRAARTAVHSEMLLHHAHRLRLQWQGKRVRQQMPNSA